MKAQGIAEHKNLARINTLQAYYSIAGRDLEREIVPLLEDQKIGLLVWSPLAGGLLSGKFTRENQKPEDSRRSTFDFPIVDKERAWRILDVIRPIAQAHNVSPATVSLAWMLAKPFVTSVIIGAKRLDQLQREHRRRRTPAHRRRAPAARRGQRPPARVPRLDGPLPERQPPRRRPPPPGGPDQPPQVTPSLTNDDVISTEAADSLTSARSGEPRIAFDEPGAPSSRRPHRRRWGIERQRDRPPHPAVSLSACTASRPSSSFSLMAPPFAPAQSSPRSDAVDPTALVRRALEHRAEADAHHRPLRYLLRKTEQRRGTTRDTTKEILETRDGDVARLIAIDGKPLPPDADRAELGRLDALAAHPELQAHRHRSEQRDAARINHLLALLPQAFLYHLEGIVPCGASQCYRLSFTPNPRFSPPDLEANVLRGIAGEAWIDRTQERLTRIDAHFTADVDFGFGLLGKINKGGTILLEQTDIGSPTAPDWELTGLQLNLTGKALLVKSLDIQITEQASHFSLAPPNLTYRDAIQLLKSSTAAH